MRVPSVLLVIPLLAGAAFCGAESDARRATPRAPPGAASLLGGFTAIAVQVLWMRADQAVLDYREDEAQLAFAAITELEPQLVSGGDFIARSLGFNFAAGHKDPRVRWSLGREGWRVLCRIVERNPGDAHAVAVRGRYALLRLSTDAAMSDGFSREIDSAGPMDAARRDFEEAIRLRPQWREPWDGLGIASLDRGLDLVQAAKFDEAAPLLRRAADAFSRVVAMMEEDPQPELTEHLEGMRGTAELARTLAEVCTAPAADRRARYEAVRGRLPDAGLPALAPR